MMHSSLASPSGMLLGYLALPIHLCSSISRLLTTTTDLPRFSGCHKSPSTAQDYESPVSLAWNLPRQLMQSEELPGVLEARDKATPPLLSPGVLEHVLLAKDSPEDLQTKLLFCNDQSFPDDPAFALVHQPYYRTSHSFTSPSSLAASHTSTETEESFSEGRVNTKQDEKVSYSAVSAGYFPYYRTYEELLGQPLTYGLNAEGKKPDNDGKDESEGDGETTTPPSLELDKRTPSSTTDEEPPAHQLLRDSTSERRPSKIFLPSGLLGLNQPFSSSGYFPYYRTEGELRIVPGLGDRFFTEKEGLENKEEGQGRETSIFSLSASCLVC